MYLLVDTVGTKHVRRPGLALGLFLLGSGCNRTDPTPAITVELQTTPQPPRVGRVSLALHVTGAATRPVSGAQIELEGDMTHAGMEPIFGHAKELQPGRYQSQMEFTMPGDWVMLLHIKLASGQQVEKQVELRGVRNP